jgi:16S rRNA (uracil1498-N3)-methyltransferase
VRVFVAPCAAGDEIRLGAEEAQHLGRVLRLRPGAAITGFDGDGREYPGVLTSLDARSGRLLVRAVVVVPPPGPPEICLAMALIRPDAFDWVVQKATELGCTRLQPLVADHCSRADTRDRSPRRQARWERIARESLKQCRRSHRLEIAEPVASRALFAAPAAGEAWLLHPGSGAARPAAAGGRPAGVIVAVGPEGGWSPAEVEAACASGFRAWRLGGYVLRAETAALAALSLVMDRWHWSGA